MTSLGCTRPFAGGCTKRSAWQVRIVIECVTWNSHEVPEGVRWRRVLQVWTGVIDVPWSLLMRAERWILRACTTSVVRSCKCGFRVYGSGLWIVVVYCSWIIDRRTELPRICCCERRSTWDGPNGSKPTLRGITTQGILQYVIPSLQTSLVLLTCSVTSSVCSGMPPNAARSSNMKSNIIRP